MTLNSDMVLGLQQNLTLTQQLVMTPQLQQAIKLLQLSRLELAGMIQQEMEENPALEEAVEDTPEENRQVEKEDPAPATEEAVKEVTIDEKVRDDIDWESYINEYNSTGRVHTERDHQEAPNYEAFTSQKTTLEAHLQWQLLMNSPSETEEQIGSLIIGNLNIDGYLRASIEEIAESGKFEPDVVETVLATMQTFDPPGVCARDLKEALLIQVKRLGIDNPILERIISEHIKNLENKNYKKIASSLNISIENVIACVNVIKYLEPKPGRKFSSEEPHYILPDIYVYKDEDDYKVVMNDDGLPKLKINRYYKESISNGTEIPKDAKAYLHEKMQAASWLIKSIHQRQKTIYAVMESIIKFQRDFFDHGVAHLKPMILKDVAEDIEMHESTISRVTTNKYAYTPQGMFELKYFFNSSIKRTNGDAMASESVKEKIKDLVAKEDPKRPLSDKKLAALLKEDNITIARRTVAKYREMLYILPSSKRKQF
ncbi:RNA polymerase, sigma 54 subunit, RpoN/SigL [Desulfocicer vacuolatum DSM 3385]|uniref:RNA polymerase, sigma 54 subunit, RpoN/SigL n=2 Tax=Desulfocicer vacuolatum TaxID=2298 RepID=A0A1W2CEB3_9BACT|nr:RNA polymerase, sigma 54 subunit, RpoN/SigL [Desulfocicer vacuolatum DSM 3385]